VGRLTTSAVDLQKSAKENRCWVGSLIEAE
jgi:hypothetical protein